MTKIYLLPLIILLFLFFIIVLMSIYFTFILIPIKKFSTEFTIEDGLKKGEFSDKELKQDNINFSFTSRFGYKLKGQIFLRDLNKIVIFNHGVTWTLYGMYKYMIPFLNNNYTCVLFDSKGHGESKGGFPAYGFYEKYDLYDCYYTIINLLKEKYFEKDKSNKNDDYFANNKLIKEEQTYKPVVGLFGESMGAAISLQALNLFQKNEISFCIVDSPFSDLEKLCYFQIMKSLKNKILTKTVFNISRLLIFLIAKFDIKNIKPIDIDDNINTPILIFHGMEDKLIPYFMSKEIYEKRKNKSLTEIYFIKSADHTKGFMLDKDFYIEKVFNFINNVVDEF